MINKLEIDFIPIIKFLGNFLGPNYEIVLFSKNKLLYIENPFDNSRQVGSPIKDVEKRFLEEKQYEKCDYITNYRALSKGKEPLRSATYFIKDFDDYLLGMLTIGFKVGDMIRVRKIVNDIINGPVNDKFGKQSGELNFIESYDNSVNGMMSSLIMDIVNQIDVPLERLTMNEKMDIVRLLDRKGTFLIKGSVAQVAKALNASEATIYRYLNKP